MRSGDGRRSIPGLRFRPGRRGMALFICLGIIVLLFVFSFILWMQSAGNVTQVMDKAERIQAEFVARGALNHALLKFRLLPTELYDAIAFSIGKNPLYDFSIPLVNEDGKWCPNLRFTFGPAFFTGTAEVLSPGEPEDLQPGQEPVSPPVFKRSAIYSFKGTRLTTSGDAGRYPWSDPHNMYTLLGQYLSDIRCPYPPGEASPVLVIHSTSHEDPAMGDNWVDPFIAVYHVVEFKVLGIDKAKPYQKDSIRVVTEGIVFRGAQVSPLDPSRRLGRTRRMVGASATPEGGTSERYEDAEVYARLTEASSDISAVLDSIGRYNVRIERVSQVCQVERKE